MMYPKHFIYSYMASSIWLRTTSLVTLSNWQYWILYMHHPTDNDSTYHSLCYTSCGALAGKWNSSVGPVGGFNSAKHDWRLLFLNRQMLLLPFLHLIDIFPFLQDSSDEKGLLSNPTKNRGCTDCLSLIVFILFWAGMVCSSLHTNTLRIFVIFISRFKCQNCHLVIITMETPLNQTSSRPEFPENQS